MDSQQQLQYYVKRIISLMSQYEENTQTLMSETRDTSDLEKTCWNTIDEKDLSRVKALHNKLCKIIDETTK